MPELVACPVCGCKVQMAEAMLGKQVRCLSCQASFIALSQPPPPQLEENPALHRPRRTHRLRPGEETRKPYCPGCGRPVGWEEILCPFCGEEFEPELGPELLGRRRQALPRRDSEPHRGSLLTLLGNICLVSGGVSVCLCGLGVIVSLPLGIVTWILANNDLSQMRSGTMDPSGKEATETGRIGAIVGMILGILFAACYAIWWFGRW